MLLSFVVISMPDDLYMENWVLDKMNTLLIRIPSKRLVLPSGQILELSRLLLSIGKLVLVLNLFNKFLLSLLITGLFHMI